jgi:hypothetical protein
VKPASVFDIFFHVLRQRQGIGQLKCV